jgi:hypothetical protein
VASSAGNRKFVKAICSIGGRGVVTVWRGSISASKKQRQSMPSAIIINASVVPGSGDLS